jgi:hypothetical protein
MTGAALVPFASRLKVLSMELFGAEAVQVYGSEEDKNTPTQCGLTGRELMQRIGEDMREIWEDCWIRAWEAEVIRLWTDQGGAFPVIVEDVRYLNEAKKIKAMGGVVIRLKRAPHSKDNHPSEIDLDHFREFDQVIDNKDQTPEETGLDVLEACRERGIV